ncbi:MAG: hypothetical protein JNJ54_20175 [Myxococcaceae bacterium]|nr:hypothetical protein [Myxococcaceae bacterium]
MSALLLAMLLAQAPRASAAPPSGPPSLTSQPAFRLRVGGHLGIPLLVGVGATGTFHVDGRPRFDVDAHWEPSGFLQSYSVGAAWRPLDRFVFVGARVRLMHFQPPWTRGFNGATDNHLGLGVETGVRLRVGPADQGVITVTVGGTWLPTQATNLQVLLGLTAGFSWAVWSR